MPREGKISPGDENLKIPTSGLQLETAADDPPPQADPRGALMVHPSPGAPFLVRPAGEVRPSRALSIARRPDAFAAQQYRMLKLKLREDLDPRLVGVTSPLPSEGKTVTSANLGLALAEGRRVRVILLDLNLRYPQLASFFGLTKGDSVAEQLLHKQRNPESPWSVLELGSRLHLMGGQERLENPAALLSSNEVPMLLGDIAEHYDYAVIDLPPVLNAADVKILQEQLDALVLVCKAGVSSRQSINQTISQLGTNKLAGVLLRDMQERYIPR